jgi:hypothetical protein
MCYFIEVYNEVVVQQVIYFASVAMPHESAAAGPHKAVTHVKTPSEPRELYSNSLTWCYFDMDQIKTKLLSNLVFSPQ